ncbi:MAG TPA: hypothetical protein VLN90_08995 [Thioalkalivibrio sp.]|nr:hypothetical protein [Thioalkalivibrio sp.]
MTAHSLFDHTPFHDLGPRNARARVALVNGDEHNINARFVLARLSAYLNSLERGDPALPGQLRQRVLLLSSGDPAQLPEEMRDQVAQAWHRVEFETGDLAWTPCPRCVWRPGPAMTNGPPPACLACLP